MARKKSCVQTITPEEPKARKQLLESPTGVEESGDFGDRSPLEAPSVQNTRDLEMTIVETLQDLQQQESPPNVPKLVSVLNQSLTAISHWSLQAQLSQLENRSAWDSRLAVENNLIKKEVEFFRNRCLNQLQSPLIDPLPPKPSLQHQLPPLASPRRVSKPGKATSRKQSSRQEPSTSLLRLVENHKPHPRMRRSSDNPSASNFVRVFHLERI
ncbi:LANO_0B05930g1_1 [Lachancea nothofagi CBS 11611]|uniref:LANO_0B05930g1_1 n=1 Tax=Lachancea nothofagi CBS 11611 TaxID=1266666 RepID=A0A1G4IYP6_9SACH|nr:LANO_0B05930g1_1 [Lachancea nothofagi CBS 11611]